MPAGPQGRTEGDGPVSPFRQMLEADLPDRQRSLEQLKKMLSDAMEQR